MFGKSNIQPETCHNAGTNWAIQYNSVSRRDCLLLAVGALQMDLLHTRLEAQFRETREEIAGLIRDHGDLAIGSVHLAQLFGGMRGLRALVCDTSTVDPELGLAIRGLPIKQLHDRCPEEIFWLLLTSFLPDDRELSFLRERLHDLRTLPGYIAPLLDGMPADTHPMTMFNAAVLTMQRESHMATRYRTLPRELLWTAALEDALEMFARLPVLAAEVYRRRYGLPTVEEPDEMDWTRDFAMRLLGRNDAGFEELLRSYVVVQSDHESGNVFAFSAHITGSTHADPYYACSAGLNGLAGHIHGLAAQDFMRFLFDLQQDLPSGVDQAFLRQILRDRLASGRVIPGFGHAVLRLQDPRFEILSSRASALFAGEPLFLLARQVYQAGTQVLVEHGRARNPYPNVDAITGVVLNLSGIRELEFYTVLFGVSLSIGMLAQYVISRGIGSPIVRPRSLSLSEVRAMLPQS